MLTGRERGRVCYCICSVIVYSIVYVYCGYSHCHCVYNVLTVLLQCVFHRGSVKNTCKMLMALGIGSREIYEEDFEKPLLKESREFYRVSGSFFLCTVS